MDAIQTALFSTGTPIGIALAVIGYFLVPWIAGKLGSGSGAAAPPPALFPNHPLISNLLAAIGAHLIAQVSTNPATHVAAIASGSASTVDVTALEQAVVQAFAAKILPALAPVAVPAATV